MKRIFSLLTALLYLSMACQPVYAAGPFIWGTSNSAQNLAPGGVYLPNQQPILFGEQTGNGTNYIALEAPDAVTTTTTLKLPDGDGGSGQILSTDGAGNLDWIDQGGDTVDPAAGAAGVTLDTSDADVQVFTPASDITVVLDDSFSAGRRMTIVNNGTAEIALNADNGDLIRRVYRKTTGIVQATVAAPDDDAEWVGLNPVVSPPIPVTLTVDAFTSYSNVEMWMKREGKKLIVTGAFLGNTVDNITSAIYLPSGLTIDDTLTYDAAANLAYAGEWSLHSAGAGSAIYAGGNAGKFFTDGSTTNQVFFATTTGSDGFQKKSANAIWASNTYTSFRYEVYVTEWEEFAE